jgi:hypothetical protein
MRADPECAKKDSQVSSVVWHFWGPMSIKAAHKMLVKLTPLGNWHLIASSTNLRQQIISVLTRYR